MKPKIVLITIAILFAIALGGITYAGGGGMGGGRGMMGGDHMMDFGMMGGDHMMDFGKGYSAPPYPDQFNRYNRPDEPDRYGPTETERLRREIREKRQELSKLYGSEKPDKDLIDKKIDELSKLEAELDDRLSGNEYQRR
jgi:hypothetical protein